MASSTITGTTSNASIESKIEWSSIPSTANNNSTVTASLYYRRTNTYSGTPTSGTGSFTITIDGQEGSVSKKLTVPNDKSWVLALTVTKTVAHNVDGTKSITISATGKLPPSSLTSTTCSGTATLDNIPRQATIVSAPDFTDEQNPTITYSNPAGSAVTALDVCISLDGARDDVAYRAIPTGGTSYTFSLTEAERNVLRAATATSNTRTVQFWVRTVIGGVTYYSALTKTLTIVNANPTFTNDQVLYWNEDSGVVGGNESLIVQNKSKVLVYIGEATANKGAHIVKYVVSANGSSVEMNWFGNNELGYINSSEDVVLSVTAHDSRGNTTTVSKNVSMVAWAEPVVNATVKRLNNYEDETYLTIGASVSPVAGYNRMSISWGCYTADGECVCSDIWICEDVGEYGATHRLEQTLECDKNSAYYFTIKVRDSFGETNKTIPLDKGVFPLFIDTEKNAVGVNQFPSDGEALRVAGGVACFDDGIVLKTPNKSFKITINDSGALVIAEIN